MAISRSFLLIPNFATMNNRHCLRSWHGIFFLILAALKQYHLNLDIELKWLESKKFFPNGPWNVEQLIFSLNKKVVLCMERLFNFLWGCWENMQLFFPLTQKCFEFWSKGFDGLLLLISHWPIKFWTKPPKLLLFWRSFY